MSEICRSPVWCPGNAARHRQAFRKAGAEAQTDILHMWGDSWASGSGFAGVFVVWFSDHMGAKLLEPKVKMTQDDVE